MRLRRARTKADKLRCRGGSFGGADPEMWTYVREQLSSQWSARIDAGIAELELLKAGLTDCIGCGCLSLDRCRLANPQDRAARFGPGPRYWLGDPAPQRP